jgi:glucose dehydrogenase
MLRSMHSPRMMRVALWVGILLSVPNVVRTVRDPEALGFFGIAMLVLAVPLTVGSAVALAIMTARRSSTHHLSIRQQP